jgi:small-conductance mechanosensitive channel
MLDQDIFSLWPQIRTELLVFLGRPSIQLQLTVVAIALVLAAVLGRLGQKQWRIRYQAWAEDARFGKKLIYHLVSQVMSGFIAVLIIQLGAVILRWQGTRTALIASLLNLVLLYLVLKALLAIALTVGGTAGIQRYQKTFIIPLFIAVIGVAFLRVFFPGDRLFNAPVFTLFDNTITLSALFLVTVGFYLWVVGIYALGQGIHFLATEYGGADAGSTQATLTLLRYLLIIIGLTYVLFRLNFNTTTIAAISGGLSVGIGFALSTILSNFVSGILLLFERTLHPGDIIEYNGILCTVEMITIRSIRVRTFDNIELVIPNSEFVTAPFTTYTGKTRHIRLKLPIGASYDDDHRHVIKTLLAVATDYPHIMPEPAPEVRIENFGDSSIDYQLYLWIASPLLSSKVKNELHHAILDAFAENNITIPYPTAIEISRIEG